jgi:predicted DNA-binding transcriptional regulator AlpA
MKASTSVSEHGSLADSASLAERLAATLIDSAALLIWLGISRGHLNHLIAEHGFPQPIRLSRRNYRWMVVDVHNWLNTTGRTIPAVTRE